MGRQFEDGQQSERKKLNTPKSKGKHQTNRLDKVGKINTPGHHADGNGLYLQVSASGAKSWILRFMLNGRMRDMGLGSYPDFPLAEARKRAKAYRQMLTNGIDPIEQRKTELARRREEDRQRRTFEQCAREYHVLHASGWKNRKHADQWINTLVAHVFPVFGDKYVSDVSKADILRALEPIWLTTPETASRLKQRIRAVLDRAAARDYRRGHDPQMWDQISRALPKTKDIKKPQHFAACPYSRAYDALESIRNSSAGDTVKRAMEFIILTAARSGEVRYASWSEIDFENKRWIIPGERMKAGKEHRIPLSPRAMEILEAQHGNGSELIFASDRNKPYSDMVFTMLLRRLGHDFTVHGFRSTFRDWAAEQTAFPREVCEAALAHSLGKDTTESAYFRSDLFEKRRQLMNAWASYCATKRAAARITPIGAGNVRS